jgi:PleD family two-component response regulator
MDLEIFERAKELEAEIVFLDNILEIISDLPVIHISSRKNHACDIVIGPHGSEAYEAFVMTVKKTLTEIKKNFEAEFNAL